MTKSWQVTLANLIDYPEMHARFLNTLSLLEYIGARKIMKSQHESYINATVLAHMSEELRHAQTLKRLASKVGGFTVQSYDERALLAGREAREYFQVIDSKAQEVLQGQNQWANYLLTTLVVEERAGEFYSLYDYLLKPLGLDGPLKTIVREEEEHLAEVTYMLGKQAGCGEDLINIVRAEEKKHFAKIFTAIEAELGSHSFSSAQFGYQ